MNRLVCIACLAGLLALSACAGDNGAPAADAGLDGGTDGGLDARDTGGSDGTDLPGGDGLFADLSDVLSDTAGDIPGDGGTDGGTDALDIATDSSALRGHWEQVPTAQLGEHVLKGLWGWPDGNVVAVGEAGLVAARVGDSFAPAFQEPSLNILNGVWGSSSQDIWTVGMYGLIYHYDGQSWGMPDYCETVEDCSFAGECLIADCLAGKCEYTPTGNAGCCGSVHFQTGFDNGAAGFVIEDSYAGTPDGGIGWNVAGVVGADGQPRYLSEPGALYFGNPGKACTFDPELLCPDFNNGKKVGGTATSPPVSIPQTAEQVALSFYVYLDVEASPLVDTLTVRVLNSGKWEEVWTKADLAGNYLKHFVPVQVPLDKYVGKTIRFQFAFDSVTPQNNALEGVYVDNVELTTTCSVAGALAGKFPTLWSVWGAAADDVFAVGSNGWVVHYDGTSWQKQAGGDAFQVAGVGGVSADDVVLVGKKGLVLHSHGQGWEKEKSGTTKDFARVWGTSPSRYVAVGPKGALAVWDGSKWNPSSLGGAGDLNDVIGFADDEYYIVGQTAKFLHYDGTTFNAVTPPTTVNLHAIWGESADDVIVVGDKIVLTGPVNALQPQTVPIVANWKAAWGTGEHRFVTGELGKMLHWDGAQWNKLATGVEVTLLDITGFAPDDVYAVGEAGTMVHYDGDKWAPVEVFGSEETTFTSIWGSGPDDIYVAARIEEAGYVLHWDGLSWKIALSSTTANLRHVHGSSGDNVFAVGQAATIMRWDGKGWGLAPIDPYVMEDGSEYIVTQGLYGVFAQADDDVWAVGEQGTIVHYDGKSFSLAGTFEYTLRAIWGLGPENLWAVGGAGIIMRFDGQQWVQEESGTVATLYAVWGDGAGNIYAVGDNGTILTYVLDE